MRIIEIIGAVLLFDIVLVLSWQYMVGNNWWGNIKSALMADVLFGLLIGSIVLLMDAVT